MLDAEVNRVYWEVHPDAPREIDPDDPTHAHYTQAWLHIRAQIMSNPPDPDDGAAAAPGVSEFTVTKLTDDPSTSLGHAWEPPVQAEDDEWPPE